MKIIIATLVALAVFVNFADAGTTLTYQEADTCVRAHNMLRRLHQKTYDLVWDADIAAKAQAWANHLAEINRPLSDTEISHDSLPGYGENIYWGSDSKKRKCAQATLSWYNEFNDYSYATALSRNGKAVGHFTQVVWTDTKKVGVGIATLQRANGQIETFIVAKYSPKGNFHYYGRRFQTYTAKVQPRKFGAVTPTVEQLDPSLIQDCKNARGDDVCNYFITTRKFSCTEGKFVKYFKENCYKKCNYC